MVLVWPKAIYRGGMSICRRCYLCNKEEESAALFLHYIVARQLWNLAFNLFDLSFFMLSLWKTSWLFGTNGIRKPARSRSVTVLALSIGFCGLKEMLSVWRESCIFINVKVYMSSIFGFLVRLTRCKGWKQYVRLHRNTTGSDFCIVRCPSFCFGRGDFWLLPPEHFSYRFAVYFNNILS